MSSPQSTTGNINYADSKAFYETYIDHRKGIIVLACVLLFCGLIVYLQVCGAECSDSDPSGFVGSSVNCSNGEDDDSNTLNGTAIGCMFTFSVVFVMLGAGMLMYYYSIVKQSHKLIDANMPYGAAIINMKKGKETDTNLLAYQTALFEEKVIKAGVDPATLCDNPYAKVPEEEEEEE